MRIGEKNQPTATTPTDDGPITRDNYVARFAAYARAHGDKWHLIRSDQAKTPGRETPAQWLAWLEWFFRHGIPHRFAHLHGVATVPAEWPEEFYPAADFSDRFAEFPASEIVSPERRAEMGARLRKLAADLEPSLLHRPKGRVFASPEEMLADTAARMAAKAPVKASPALLATLGLSPIERGPEAF
jgi:hypothetical protein